MVSYSQLVVKIGDIFTDLGAHNLLLDGDGLEHQVLSAGELLLLSQLHSDPLHGTRLLLLGLLGGLACPTLRQPCASSLAPILHNARAFRLDRERLRQLTVDRHATAIYTLTIFATIHLLEALIEDRFRLFPLIALLISLRQRNLQLKHGIVVMLQNLRCQLVRLLDRIKRLVVLTLVRENAGRFLVEVHEDALVCDFVFGELEPAFRLRRIFFELAIQRGKRHAKPAKLL